MKKLIVILGPTGVGKTELSLRVAAEHRAPIISADSRQMYRDLPVCTAAATASQQARVPHFFVGNLGLDEAYSAARFEQEALDVIARVHEVGDTAVMCGGSMMYIDAVCRGIDDMPQADPAIRQRLREQLQAEGIEPLLSQLEALDPAYYATVDRQNTQRVVHGLEMCLTTGRPFSSFRTGTVKTRPFVIEKIGLTRPRQELYSRIDRRVDEMLASGLIDETRAVYDRYRDEIGRQLACVVRNPGPTEAQPIPNLMPSVLNTVGLKEMLLYFEGIYTIERAKERICRNTHIYAKKQMTWFQRDPAIAWTTLRDC
ncbi:MAG: tRNA (adenosine(37)-N6)-dimethylallyltransferase MiaA [Bacteroidales bacterium]|nr:tRNA (adenosine(37)-N6)-dimethylallyltransferase MiaA [Candidatus Liminaster caballi]